MRYSRKIGAQISKYRRRCNKNYQEMADLLGCSYADYRSLENGVCMASYKNLQKIANILNVTVDDLLKEMPFGEYKAEILGSPLEYEGWEFDALLDHIENMVIIETLRAVENYGKGFETSNI